MKITPNVPTGAFTLNAWATWDVLFDDNDKAVALFSSKSKLSQLAMAAPEMLELIQALAVGYDEDDGQGIYQRIDDFIDFTHQAQALLAKIEGGEA